MFESDSDSEGAAGAQNVARGQQVIEVDAELAQRFADLSMPGSYVLACQRIQQATGELRPGRVTVVDGKIAAIALEPLNGNAAGKDAEESELPVLNLGDLVLTPGLVTAHMPLASGASTGEPDSSYYVAASGIDLQDERVLELTRSGVLYAAVAPPSSNVLAGQISAVRLAGDDPIVSDSIADKLVVASSARRNDRFPASMEGQFDFIRRRFAGDLEPNRTKMPSVVAEAMKADSEKGFADLAAGRRLAVIEARTPAELRGSLRLIKALNLNARLLLPGDLKTVLPQIRAQKIGLIIRPAEFSDPQWYLGEITQAAEAGSLIGVAAQDAVSLRKTAALLVSQGLDPQRALRLMTSEAADCVGMPSGSATITVGQPADMVIWSGPPYKMTSRCLSVLSDGRVIDQESTAFDLSARTPPTRASSP